MRETDKVASQILEKMAGDRRRRTGLIIGRSSVRNVMTNQPTEVRRWLAYDELPFKVLPTVCLTVLTSQHESEDRDQHHAMIEKTCGYRLGHSSGWRMLAVMGSFISI